MHVIELDRRIGYAPRRARGPAPVDDERFALRSWEPRRRLDSFCQGRSRARAWLEFGLTILAMLVFVAAIAGIRTWYAVHAWS
jgi:hypothetical protein